MPPLLERIFYKSCASKISLANHLGFLEWECLRTVKPGGVHLTDRDACCPLSQADLCGLKWRRLSTEHSSSSVGSGGGVEPLSEPVLWSFAKCLAADLLCVWRRVARPEQPHRRELWLFWYGEEPDLNGLVSPELTGQSLHMPEKKTISFRVKAVLRIET
ncbi:hypothetical protein HPB48_005839 [Haemaphysalis longicornis]|uniref:Mediator of RNA polymerase II transcription subunit 13 n=1 Tax=Haemaphysalis longicornis TaxID=44386 RepID=A0A9J6GQW9_HAELO|nr:hypothetical protein HPB48_005839 [Haemaphysalis longicornis]